MLLGKIIGSKKKSNKFALLIIITLTQAMSLAEGGNLPESYFLLDTKTHLGDNLSVADEAVKAALAQQIIDDAQNAGSLGKLEVSYSLLDTLGHIADASNGVVAGAKSYSLLDGALAIEGPQTVALARAEVAKGQALVDGAANGKSVVYAPVYEIADTLANIETNFAFVEGAQSYALTNAPGSLGPLTPAQIAIVEGATDASEYTWGVATELTIGKDTIVGQASTDELYITAPTNAQGLPTFQSWDSIDGGEATSTTIAASMNGNSIAPTLKNIQHIELQDVATSIAHVNSLNVSGLASLETLKLNGVTGFLDGFSVTGLGSLPEVHLNAVGGSTTLGFTKAAAVGVDQTLDIHVSDVHGLATGISGNLPTYLSDAIANAFGGYSFTGISLPLDLPAAGLFINGNGGAIENITLRTGEAGADSRLGGLTVTNTGTTMLTIEGASDLDVGKVYDASGTLRHIHASDMTGDLRVEALSNSTVMGSQGSNWLVSGGGSQNNFSGGNEADYFDFVAGLANTNIVTGNGGYDILRGTATDLVNYAPIPVSNVTGIEALSARGQLAGTIVTPRFGDVNTVILENGTAGDAGIVFNSGEASVLLGQAVSDAPIENLLNPLFQGANEAELNGTLTLSNLGVLTTDSATIVNLGYDGSKLGPILGGDNLGQDLFNGQSINTLGFETLTIDNGVETVASSLGGEPARVDIGNVTLAGTSGVSTTLNFVGENTVDFHHTNGVITATTIDARGLEETGVLRMDHEFPPIGTKTIFGSDNTDLKGFGDELVAAAGGTKILAGAGKDLVWGSAPGGVDNIDGGLGNDYVKIQEDTLLGNAPIGKATTATYDGGEGIDTFEILNANQWIGFGSANNLLGVKNFEILEVDSSGVANVSLDQFVHNPGFTTLIGEVTAPGNTVNFWGADNHSLTTFGLEAESIGGNYSVSLFADTASDAITVANVDVDHNNGHLAAAVGANTVTLNDFESIAITTDYVNPWTGLSTSGDINIGTLASVDLTSMKVSGTNQEGVISNVNLGAIAAPSLTLLDASGLQGSFTANAAGTSTDLTFKGALGVNTFTSGTGNDVIEGNVSADILDGNWGFDVINGNGGNDNITGNLDGDLMTGGDGRDTFVQNSGDSVYSTANFLSGSVTVGDWLQFQNFAPGVDVITDFQAGAAGDFLQLTQAVVGNINSLLGQASAAVGQGVWVASGTWNGGRFTIAADGAGPDTMIIQSDGATDNNLTANAGAGGNLSVLILEGVNSNSLVTGNFVNYVASATITGDSSVANVYSVYSDFAVSGVVGVDATLVGDNITEFPLVDAIAYNPDPSVFAPATVESITLAGLVGGLGSVVATDAAVNLALDSVTGTSATSTVPVELDLPTFEGDTLEIQNAGVVNIDGVIGGGYSVVTNVENIYLAQGSTGQVTIGAGVNQAVTVVNGTGPLGINNNLASTVVFANTNSNTFWSNSAGADTVTLDGSDTAYLYGSGVLDTIAGATATDQVITDAVTLNVGVAAALDAAYTNTGAAASTLLLADGETGTVTAGVFTGFETLNLGVVGEGGLTVDLAVASSGITTISADTSAAVATVGLSVAQLDALTNILNPKGASAFTFDVNSGSGAVNLAGVTILNPVASAFPADLVVDFTNADKGGVQLTDSAAHVAQYGAGVTGGLIGSAFADTLTLTTALATATGLNTVTEFETIVLAGGAQAATPADSVVTSGEVFTIDASALTGVFTFDGSNEADGGWIVEGSTFGNAVTFVGPTNDPLVANVFNSNGTGNSTITLGSTASLQGYNELNFNSAGGDNGVFYVNLVDTSPATDLTSGAETVTGFTVGLTALTGDAFGFAYTTLDIGSSTALDTESSGVYILQTVHGAELESKELGVVGRGLISEFSVAADGTAYDTGAGSGNYGLIKLTSTTGTDFGTAIGLSTVNLGDVAQDNLVLVTWYENDTSQAHLSVYVGDSNVGNDDIMSNATDLVDVAVIGMTAADYANWGANQLYTA